MRQKIPIKRLDIAFLVSSPPLLHKRLDIAFLVSFRADKTVEELAGWSTTPGHAARLFQGVHRWSRLMFCCCSNCAEEYNIPATDSRSQ